MNSVLNPEAPAFYPDLASFTEESYVKIGKTIKSSNRFPSRSSYDFFKTFTEFNIIRSQFSECVVNQSNELLSAEMPSVKLTYKNLERNIELIVDVNDFLLDKVEINMNSLNNADAQGAQFEDGMKPSNPAGPSKDKKVEDEIEAFMNIEGPNVPRPQLTFKDPVDNSAGIWVPKIKEKPNSMVPFVLYTLYDENGETTGYEHPYKIELNLFGPPDDFITPDREAPVFPLPMEQTKFTYIDTESQLDELVKHLSTVEHFAVDVEHHWFRSYQGITCLIQISTDEGGDFIIDTIAVREHVHKLNAAFTHPRKLKVFHGADMDVLWLQRDFGVYIVGLFDTYRAAKLLKLQGMSLKFLLMKYCGIDADKTYQLADWRVRPLPQELIDYARLDTHYLLYISRRMKADLFVANDGLNSLVNSVFNASAQVCLRTYEKTVIDDTSYLSLFDKTDKPTCKRQETAIKLLYKWRDDKARELDESPAYVLPNHMLLTLATILPREIEGMYGCCNPVPHVLRKNMIEVHRILLSCRELPSEPFLKPSETAPAPRPRSPKIEDYNVLDLSGLAKLPRDDPSLLDKPIEYDKNFNDDDVRPRLEIMIPDDPKPSTISNLNVHAEMYIPPYYRYRGYRYLTQDQDIKEFEHKQAKIEAIAQGDPLIQSEVIDKMKEKRETLEQPSHSFTTSVQRKRKMSKVNVKSNNAADAQFENRPSTSGINTQKAKSDAQTGNDKVDCKGFSKNPKAVRKQAKKFIKHK